MGASAPQNKATILGAPAPQLAALLKQQPGAAGGGAGGAPNAGFGAAAGSAASGPAAPGPAASHPCPRCSKPLEYVAQYQRWFCGACQQYR